MRATDRVRARTAGDVLRRIDDGAVTRLTRSAHGGAQAATEGLQALDREWDTDRALELHAAALSLLGLALGRLAWRPLLAVPGIVSAALLLQAVSGLYPPMLVFRRLGLRSPREIARERYALKALRGDFAGLEMPPPLVVGRHEGADPAMTAGEGLGPDSAQGEPAEAEPDLERERRRGAAPGAAMP